VRREWGVEAVVANFDERLAGIPGAEIATLSLEEIFTAVVGDEQANGGAA